MLLSTVKVRDTFHFQVYWEYDATTHVLIGQSALEFNAFNINQAVGLTLDLKSHFLICLDAKSHS